MIVSGACPCHFEVSEKVSKWVSERHASPVVPLTHLPTHPLTPSSP